MRVAFATVGMGGIYPQLATRLLQRFAVVCPNYEVRAWINTKPDGAPFMLVDGHDYSAYCAKPFVMDSLMMAGYDIVIWLDASFFPIRDVMPMVSHIEENGYYFCDNEMIVGEWCSDACADAMGVTRESLMAMPELSSYCVGLDLRRGECQRLLAQWKSAAYSRNMFPGHMTAGSTGRDHGFVSADPRVKGHRMDQTVLSIMANQFGMTNFVKRPKLTAYAAMEWNEHHLPPTDETVLVNWGQLNVRFDE